MKILHGGRFCSHDQTHSECGSNLKILPTTSRKIQGLLLAQILPPNSSEAKKKRSFYRNLVISLARIWDLLKLSATFSSKYSEHFLLVGRCWILLKLHSHVRLFSCENRHFAFFLKSPRLLTLHKTCVRFCERNISGHTPKQINSKQPLTRVKF